MSSSPWSHHPQWSHCWKKNHRLCPPEALHSLAVGFLMSTKGLVELIVLNLGYSLKVINQIQFTIMVLMALITTFLTSPVVACIYPKRLMLLRERANFKKGSEFSVLLCISNRPEALKLLMMAKNWLALNKKVSSSLSLSQSLSPSLSVADAQVHKLLRIRRLLQRLSFLSELPEKLSLLIQRERVAEAVLLYNRSVKVLQRHAAVLSFKRIEERVQSMMRDLRTQVLSRLDNPELEADQVGFSLSVSFCLCCLCFIFGSSALCFLLLIRLLM